MNVATNLAIDDKLLNEAKRLGQFRTKKETVNTALEEFILRRQQLKILKLEGSIVYAAGFDHKRFRSRKLRQK